MSLLLATIIALFGLHRISTRQTTASPTPAAASAGRRAVIPIATRAARRPLSSPGAMTPARVPQFGDAGFGVNELFGTRAA